MVRKHEDIGNGETMQGAETLFLAFEKIFAFNFLSNVNSMASVVFYLFFCWLKIILCASMSTLYSNEPPHTAVVCCTLLYIEQTAQPLHAQKHKAHTTLARKIAIEWVRGRDALNSRAFVTNDACRFLNFPKMKWQTENLMKIRKFL